MEIMKRKKKHDDNLLKCVHFVLHQQKKKVVSEGIFGMQTPNLFL